MSEEIFSKELSTFKKEINFISFLNIDSSLLKISSPINF